MTYSAIITQDWIAKYTPINSFVDMSILVPFIRVSQEIHVRSLLGKALYDRIVEGYVANDLTANEQILLNLILPSLAYDMVARNLPFIATQVRSAGVIKVSNPNIESADQKAVDSLENRAQSISDYYSQRVIEYLCENASLYPLYRSTEDPQANSRTRYGNFYFDDDGCGCNTCH